MVIQDLLGKQSDNIAEGIVAGGELGAGDQGLMFGYATDETPELLPLPLVLAHRLTRGLAERRKSGSAPWLRPDAKAQVTVRYEGLTPLEVDTVVVSTQHMKEFPVEELQRWITDTFLFEVLGVWWHPGITVHANPAGAFIVGGPEGDCGITGRKIIVDSYGGMARHGGGAFSGKDGTKVDRSAAYFARYVARQLVLQGLAKRAELQVCYAIGVAQPVALHVDTYGTGDTVAAEQFARQFDYRPAAIIEQLHLRTPLFSSTTNYGHFGKAGLPWRTEPEHTTRHEAHTRSHWRRRASTRTNPRPAAAPQRYPRPASRARGCGAHQCGGSGIARYRQKKSQAHISFDASLSSLTVKLSAHTLCFMPKVSATKMPFGMW